MADEDRNKREDRNTALRKSFAETMPQTQGQSIRSGAEIDAQIAALEARCAALETVDVQTDKRLDVLEAGDTTTPPVEPPIEPPVTGKRYPDKGDAMCGVPAGTTLTTTGGTTLTTAGAKVSGKKFTGKVVIKAANVELFNCEIVTNDWYALDIEATGANVHHCTITSTATTGNSGVDLGNGSRIANCRFRGWENAFNVANVSGVTIEWNDVDGLLGNSSSHYDCLQADGNTDGLIIRNNRFNCGYGWTSATMIDNYWGRINNVTIENNWLGGGGMPCYLDGSFKSEKPTNVKYLNNDLKKGQWNYFYWRDAGTGCERKGNKDYQTGANVDNEVG